MITNVNIWIASFLVSLAFFIPAMVIFWVSTREFWVNRKIKPLIFGLGILGLASINIALKITNSEIIPFWAFIIYAIGLSALVLSLSTKKWHYLLIVGIGFPLFLPQTFPLNVLFLIFSLPIIYLSYSNFCVTSCSRDCEAKNSMKKEGREWGLIFAGIIFSAIIYISSRSPEFIQINQTLYIIGMIFEGITVGVLFLHTLKCLKFSRIEKYVIPIMTGSLATLTVLGFFLNIQITGFTTGELEKTVSDELGAVKTIAEMTYPNNELARKIKSRDIALNDLSDLIYTKTNIGVTFFSDNERVASVPSTSGKGRMIGTKTEDSAVINAVLKNGEIYVGTISKGGSLFIAGYAPIYDGDEVIGMISTGKLLNSIYELQQKILMRAVAGVSVVVLIAYAAMFYILPKKSKS